VGTGFQASPKFSILNCCKGPEKMERVAERFQIRIEGEESHGRLPRAKIFERA